MAVVKTRPAGQSGPEQRLLQRVSEAVAATCHGPDVDAAVEAVEKLEPFVRWSDSQEIRDSALLLLEFSSREGVGPARRAAAEALQDLKNDGFGPVLRH